ncbi:hypothetical protein BKA62DRAFT_758413 [Auriculariales sp. MPI-PUGE-AT-0066]|nr:hypothetical protein BKA62DRAFT_758413 [Auriculariales sp. MPI-PUGE-AT-0066]
MKCLDDAIRRSRSYAPTSVGGRVVAGRRWRLVVRGKGRTRMPTLAYLNATETNPGRNRICSAIAEDVRSNIVVETAAKDVAGPMERGRRTRASRSWQKRVQETEGNADRQPNVATTYRGRVSLTMWSTLNTASGEKCPTGGNAGGKGVKRCRTVTGQCPRQRNDDKTRPSEKMQQKRRSALGTTRLTTVRRAVAHRICGRGVVYREGGLGAQIERPRSSSPVSSPDGASLQCLDQEAGERKEDQKTGLCVIYQNGRPVIYWPAVTSLSAQLQSLLSHVGCGNETTPYQSSVRDRGAMGRHNPSDGCLKTAFQAGREWRCARKPSPYRGQSPTPPVQGSSLRMTRAVRHAEQDRAAAGFLNTTIQRAEMSWLPVQIYRFVPRHARAHIRLALGPPQFQRRRLKYDNKLRGISCRSLAKYSETSLEGLWPRLSARRQIPTRATQMNSGWHFIPVLDGWKPDPVRGVDTRLERAGLNPVKWSCVGRFQPG